jgi:hypothetical protein
LSAMRSVSARVARLVQTPSQTTSRTSPAAARTAAPKARGAGWKAPHGGLTDVHCYRAEGVGVTHPDPIDARATGRSRLASAVLRRGRVGRCGDVRGHNTTTPVRLRRTTFGNGVCGTDIVGARSTRGNGGSDAVHADGVRRGAGAERYDAYQAAEGRRASRWRLPGRRRCAHPRDANCRPRSRPIGPGCHPSGGSEPSAVGRGMDRGMNCGPPAHINDTAVLWASSWKQFV